MRAHIHLHDLPAAAMLLPGIQAFPRASESIRPALTIEAIQRVWRGAEIRLPDWQPGGILPRVTRPLHGDFVGPCDPSAGSGSGGADGRPLA